MSTEWLISENPSWNLKSRTLAPRKQHYRIEDPYTRFYIKYIRPALGEIEKGHYEKISLRQLPGWETIRGLQFQCLVTPRMVPTLLRRLRLDGVLILRSGPYYQSATRRRKPAQIDYLLQTADTLYVCETKFRKHIDASVIDEVRQKIDRLEKDPGLSVRKALIYSGERAPGAPTSSTRSTSRTCCVGSSKSARAEGRLRDPSAPCALLFCARTARS
jgi:uncharacterized protein